MPYRSLDPAKILKTLTTLHARISERFPKSGLANVCEELIQIAGQSQERVARIATPNMPLRIASWTIVAFGLCTLVYVASIIEYKREAENLFGVLEGIEALLNTVVLMGAGVFFLATIESRWKRQKALDDLHQLRAIVHVIDMHQLTKDPRIVPESHRTKSSPVHQLTPFQLTRYLDYCSEMLSLTAKIAALYAQSARDNTVLHAVSELETVSANLSSKIWQKITMIQSDEHARDIRDTVRPPNRAPRIVSRASTNEQDDR
ncbi:MAG: hypothetical protein AAGC70_15085 [Pseudomonadota bacterium]